MSDRLILNIDGMDCPSCTSKIEGAVCSLPGVENVSLNYTNQKLKLDLVAGGDAAKVKKVIEKLGYKVKQYAGNEAPKRWWQTGKGQLVIASGFILAIATVLSFLLPAYAGYVFAAGALLALVPLARKAVSSALIGQPFTIEMLVTIAVFGAIVIDEAAEASVVVFLFLIGELLEMMAAAKARSSVQALADLVPKSARLVSGDTITEVEADTLNVGDIIEVRPGGRVPADGTLTMGETAIDEAAVTGESMPKHKTVGDAVFAGSINTDGLIRIEVTQAAENNMIARILQMVEDAEASKAPTARFIDRFSRYYTPGVIVVAAMIAFLPPLVVGADLGLWVYKGLAILLIGCPCALVLSTPAAITSGISTGARQGLLMKGGAVLEAIGKVGIVAFDKTGTLSEGTPKVTDIAAFTGTEDDMLALAAAVEAGSSHPLAAAITEHAKGLKIAPATDSEALRGRGVRAMVGGADIVVASPRYAAEITTINPGQAAQIETLETEGKTVAAVLKDNQLIGIIAMRDELREDAVSSIATLKSMGVSTIMLTGDNARTGSALAAQLGMEVKAELMPEDKLKIIEQLRETAGVAMVGDGINDAPALARADVGIAMGGGTDVALETADAALLHEKVSDVPALIDLSRVTMANIYQNITIALGLKAVFLVTTLFGITSLWMAILADTGATVLVTLNALRLLGYKPKR
ncbi:MAG: heavy metal translocating P-type ATPase [Rhodobacteraceae bacterium]|nr:heavy metal translocating P-type ATPase [Paracoccaceae bacterium]